MAINITEPKDKADVAVGEPVLFTGTADKDVVRVELLADGRWTLGQNAVMGGGWSITYPFNRSGSRNISARGFDAGDNLVANDSVWVFVNPAKISLDMQLTANFTLRQLVASTTADRLGIDNTPNTQEIGNLRTLCTQILQPAWDALGGIRVNSGFRSEALNKQVGGVPNSDHRLGFAVDIVPVNTTSTFGPRQLAEWIAKNTSFDQLILEFGTVDDPNWIHVSANPKGRKEILRAFSQGGTTVYERITL